MGRIIYSVASSLDGFNAGVDGDFSWAYPGEDAIAAMTADLAGVSTFLYGRRMYEVMSVWETDPDAAEGSPESEVFAEVWRAADKVVFSTTLDERSVRTSRTRVVRSLDPDSVARERDAATGDCTIEGPTVARQVLAMGLVDVVELLVFPVVVGAGNRVFPANVTANLRLRRERRFEDGLVQLTYDVSRRP